MGIQINGQTDSISAIDGSLTFSTSSVQQVADINATGIITAASANFTGNVSIGGTLTYQDVTNIDSVGIITARAGIELADNIKIKLGTSDDLQIYHDGSDSFIDDTGTGRLNIRGNTGVSLRNYSDSEQFINCYTNGAVELFHDNSKKFHTYSGGCSVFGNFNLEDNDRIRLGNSSDLQIYHDGNNSFITDTGTGRLTISTNQLQLTNAADSEVMIKATQDGAVEFYYDNVKKFETHTDGLHIGDGGNLDMPHDSSKIVMGASDDLQIYHDGNNSFIKDAGTGRLSIVTSQLQVTNAADSEVMIKATQDGAVELYHDNSKKFHTYSGGCSVFGNFNLEDNDRIRLGNSSDLQIYHDGTNSYILDNGAGHLNIKTNGTDISFTKTPHENLAKFIVDGACELYHDNTKRLETRSTGIRVTGRIEINGSNGRIEYNNIANTFEFFTGGNKVAEFLSAGHFVPGTNNTYDLGSSSYRWRNIYTNDLNLSNEGSTNDVDGTWGNYTIQEGENDLFLINKRNGKKYKFNLTEVN